MREVSRDSEWIPMVPTSQIRNIRFERIVANSDRPYVAVASRQGRFVDEHLGLAGYLWIYGKKDRRLGLVGTRKTPDPVKGEYRWQELAGILKDCRAVLANGVAEPPVKVFGQEGIQVINAGGRVEEALEQLFAGDSVE